MELDLSDMRVRFQYGMHNPDYPSVIRRKQFILDYDAYREETQTGDELERNLMRFHSKIQELFEQSITDELRRIMNERVRAFSLSSTLASPHMILFRISIAVIRISMLIHAATSTVS